MSNPEQKHGPARIEVPAALPAAVLVIDAACSASMLLFAVSILIFGGAQSLAGAISRRPIWASRRRRRPSPISAPASSASIGL